MIQQKSRIERWTEKAEIVDGITTIFLKPPRNCREAKPKKHRSKKAGLKNTTDLNKKGTRMKLLTKQIEKKLPSLATVENQSMEELVVIVKFFHPLLPWTWFVFGGSPVNDDYMFYGKVFNPNCRDGELCYFTLSQLQSIETPFGPTTFRVERGKLFKPTPATQLSL